MKIPSFAFFAFVAAFLLLPSNALACACCADAGYYSAYTKKPESLELDELKKIRFGGADLFMTAGEDNISGISPIGGNYSLNGSLQSKIWKMNFKDDKGKIGTLNLLMPTAMENFAVDIRDDKQSAEPLLYKEWRFKSKVQSGTGIFQKGIAPATEYFLVLQGRGNACTQAEDFRNWRLEITGKKADYAFFGSLSSGKISSR